MQWKVGLSRRVITPQHSMTMAGFASRELPSQGIEHDLWAKAMAIRDDNGATVVVICVDLIVVTTAICEAVARNIAQSHGLAREALVFNASHTHSGPALVHPVTDSMLIETMDDYEIHRERVRAYSAWLVEALTQLIAQALDDLRDAELSFGNGQAHFAVNRRQPTPHGYINGSNPAGPNDPDVPVIAVRAPDGTVRALLFGYACHTTSVTSENLLFNGDYAGCAQLELEAQYPGAQAMFLMLCGADQNALPRGTIEHARDFGAQLRAAVNGALAGEMTPLNGALRAATRTVDLELMPHTRQTFEARLNAENHYRVRHARAMLETYDRNAPIRQLPYLVQALAIGDLTLLALSGEVVVNYALRAKRELDGEMLIVAGYCNDVPAYIPSERVLDEGGYEGGDAMIYFGLPTSFAAGVEAQIFSAIHEVISANSSSKNLSE